MAAVVNSPAAPAETILPEIEAVQHIEERTDVTVVGETFKEVTLWNGKLNADTDLDLIAEAEAKTHETHSVAKAAQANLIVTGDKTYISAEAEVRAYFADIPIMIEVAKCESRFRHYDTEGDVLRGVVNNLDRGVMQINEGYHNTTSQKLGLDILTLQGNLAYARYLYETQGTAPWKSSSPCWGRYADPVIAHI